MKRLIERGLMFGNLVRVDTPALVARYNRALEKLTGRRTDLTDFHIDLSGYSPEVGDQLGDHLYLNENGCNRQFILLTTEQKRAPLLNAKFSTSRAILRRFIEENEAQLFALTARDAVIGEMLNSVYDVSEPARLLDLRRITIEADTTEGHVEIAGELARMIERFRKEENAWRDEALIAEMILLAQKTGDVTRSPIRLRSASFRQDNFWTAHFGGLYIFQGVEHPAAISESEGKKPDGLPMKYVFDLSNRNRIAHFLDLNDLVEPIVQARGIDAASILRRKMDFIVMDVAAERGDDPAGASRRDLRAYARRHAGDLPEEFHALSALLRWAEGGGKWPRISAGHPAYFYTLRAAPHADRDLVNMLLAALSPRDFFQLFITHKELFYRRYATWPEAKKDFVADFLEREYLADKAGAREALFGTPEARETGRGGDAGNDLIDLVGPWGAVRKRRR